MATSSWRDEGWDASGMGVSTGFCTASSNALHRKSLLGSDLLQGWPPALRLGRHADSAVQQVGLNACRINVSVLCFLHDIERRPGRRVGLLDQSVTPPPSQIAKPQIGALPRRSAWQPRGRSRFLQPRILAAAAAVLLVLAYAGREIYLRFTHIYEYDARVTADIVTVSSRADGWVVEMPAL